MFDRSRSLAVDQRLQLEKKACYRNALLAFLSTEEFRSGWYVEGFAIPTVKGMRLPLEHGWVALPDGSVIDVTYATLGCTNVEYFPALRLARTQAMALVRRAAPLPYMLRHRSNHNRSAYRKARAAAYQAAFGSDVLG